MYTIYSTPTCGYCKMAKDLLTKMNLPFSEITINSNTIMEQLETELGYKPKTVPQIFFGKVHVGGYDDLVKSLKW